MKVAGVDLSLTSTGVALATPDRCRVARVQSKGSTDDTIEERSVRLRGIVARVWPLVSDADLVVVENPAFSQNMGSSHDRSGLWWLLVGRLTGASIPTATVSPTTLKVYGTGKGNTPKDGVLAAVIRRYTDVNVQGNDEADALLLACMGLRHLGQPYDLLPESHTRAMAAVVWPKLLKGAAR